MKQKNAWQIYNHLNQLASASNKRVCHGLWLFRLCGRVVYLNMSSTDVQLEGQKAFSEWHLSAAISVPPLWRHRFGARTDQVLSGAIVTTLAVSAALTVFYTVCSCVLLDCYATGWDFIFCLKQPVTSDHGSLFVCVCACVCVCICMRLRPCECGCSSLIGTAASEVAPETVQQQWRVNLL